jgi:Tol biopolymer transport system component
MSVPKLLPYWTIGIASLLARAAAASPQHPLECVSVSSTGESADDDSYYPSISADGRYVAFSSDATNLVPGDSNGVSDVFRKDRLSGEVVRVSVGPGGVQADDESYTSYATAISADGRYIVFASEATNLVPGDTNGFEDVFVRDVVAGTTMRVSVGPGGVEADGLSQIASISADGNRVAFQSWATNLLAQRSHPLHVYVHDVAAGVNLLASVSASGEPADGASQWAAISGNGEVVAFTSNAHNLGADVPQSSFAYMFYLHDFGTGFTRPGVVTPSLLEGSRFAILATLSHDGKLVAFWSDDEGLVPGDTNGTGDTYVLDVETDLLRRVSVSSTGGEGSSLGDFPKISADGRFVGFESDSTTLVPDDANGLTDAFVHDLATGATNRASVAADGTEATHRVSRLLPAVARGFSADGRYVLFTSACDRLVPADENRKNDVFVEDRGALVPAVFCEAKIDSQGCRPAMGFAGLPSASSSGAFDVRAEPLPAGRLGLLLYGYGPSHEPFAGGVRCVAPPLRRAAVVTSSGVPGSGCTGSIDADFNARIRSGADPALVPGTVVYAQFLYRDPSDPAGANLGLSDGLRFVIQP